MSPDLATAEILDSLIGKSIQSYGHGESGGMHFTLSDGRVLVFLGVLAVYYPNEKVH